MRLMAGQWLSGRVERRLDWFRLRRRFQWLARSIYWAIDYDDQTMTKDAPATGATFEACDRMSGITANHGTRDG